jgi:hypothetical protein
MNCLGKDDAMSRIVATVAFLVLFVVGASAGGQDAAPSSHMVFDDNFPGDMVILSVRVPADGEALYTYYEGLGWRGTAAGYAGLQAHPNGHNFICSVWDNPAHTAAITAVHRGPGTKTEGFGGEGTGLKSWNFELGWDVDAWYTLVGRCWRVGDHTQLGMWVHSEPTNEWTHLVTFDVAVAGAQFEGGTDAFLEDWLDTGKNGRTTNLRGGWKRRLDGSWYPFSQARYSVNAWDLEPGKRSFAMREVWDGGVRGEGTDAYYFMSAGGKVTPSTANPSQHAIARTETSPPFPTGKLRECKVAPAANNGWRLSWDCDPEAAPPFAFVIETFANDQGTGTPLTSEKIVEPHQRASVVNALEEGGQRPRSVRLTCIDLFDREADSRLVVLP